MKIVAISTYSQNSKSTVADEFTLTLSNLCGDNDVKLDSSLTNKHGTWTPGNIIYFIDDPMATYAPIFSTVQKLTDCPVRAKLLVEQSADVWIEQTTPTSPYSNWIKDFDSTTGILLIH